MTVRRGCAKVRTCRAKACHGAPPTGPPPSCTGGPMSAVPADRRVRLPLRLRGQLPGRPERRAWSGCACPDPTRRASSGPCSTAEPARSASGRPTQRAPRSDATCPAPWSSRRLGTPPPGGWSSTTSWSWARSTTTGRRPDYRRAPADMAAAGHAAARGHLHRAAGWRCMVNCMPGLRVRRPQRASGTTRVTATTRWSCGRSTATWRSPCARAPAAGDPGRSGPTAGHALEEGESRLRRPCRGGPAGRSRPWRGRRPGWTPRSGSGGTGWRRPRCPTTRGASTSSAAPSP